MKLMLDTNVWSHLARQGASESFHRLVKRRSITVAVAPATVLELLRTPDVDLRRKSAKLVARSRWERMPTEAQSEVIELIAEISRLRHEWLLDEPLWGRHADLALNWKHGIWEAARRDSEAAIRYAQSHAVDAREGIVDFQRERSKEWREAGFMRELGEFAMKLNKMTASPAPSDEKRLRSLGWRPGTSVEAWRLEALYHFHLGLFRAKVPYGSPTEGSAYADWFEVFVNLNEVSLKAAEFCELLLYDMSANALPRAWMRWAIGMAQHTVKASTGNAVDGQLSTYLYDAEIFVTSDKRFFRVLEAIRSFSPQPFAIPAYLDPSEDLAHGIEVLVDNASAGESTGDQS
jgi:hypothetical protein